MDSMESDKLLALRTAWPININAAPRGIAPDLNLSLVIAECILDLKKVSRL